MPRKEVPAPKGKQVNINETAVAQDFSAANALAAVTREADARTRAVAQKLGYQLPAECTDPDLIQRDISANMRRSVEAVLQVGQGLCVLKEACAHGQFGVRLDVLGIDATLAKRLMQAAAKFSKGASTHLLKAAGNQTKLLELLVLDDEQVAELELTGQTGELDLDDIATMSVRELRAALREERQERTADAALLEKKNNRIDKLERDARRVKALPPDEAYELVAKESLQAMRDALGAIRGGVRAALEALNDAADAPHKPVFMASLVGELQAELSALREEYSLPDVSTAADRELAADVAAWTK